MVTAEVLEEEKKKREENAQVRDKIIQRHMVTCATKFINRIYTFGSFEQSGQ